MKTAIGHYIFIQQLGNEPTSIPTIADLISKSGFRAIELLVINVAAGELPRLAAIEESLAIWSKHLTDRGISVYGGFAAFDFHNAFYVENRSDIHRSILLAREAFPEMEYLIINPNPLDWNNPHRQKSDAELAVQAETAKDLAAFAKAAGLRLSYHFHTHELVDNQREMNFMLNALRPEEMAVTLDTSWSLYSGIAPSEMLCDLGSRVETLHLRGSENHVWQECLTAGEEHNDQIIRDLRFKGFNGLVTVEISDDPVVKPRLDLLTRLQKSLETYNRWRDE